MKFDVDNHTNNVQQITTLPTGNDLNDYQLARDRSEANKVLGSNKQSYK